MQNIKLAHMPNCFLQTAPKMSKLHHIWLTRSGEFTVKSMYLDVINSTSLPSSKYAWAVKVPLKIKVFMWFVHKRVI